MNASTTRHHHGQHALPRIQESRVPTLFRLAAESCARHIHLFGALDGLPFEPYGQAILNAFIDLEHQLSSWQRQVGILVFAESYGYHHHHHHPYGLSQPTQQQLHPPFSRAPSLAFSGLSRLSTISELSLLPSFAECLVYLDLSAAGGSSPRVSLSDHDLVALAGMKQLQVLSLAGQEGISDLGLGHLINSVEFEVGLQRLEYLNLQDTGLSDQGLARLWRPLAPSSSSSLHHPSIPQTRGQEVTRNDGRCVWRHLLGIDLSGTNVHPEVAQSLFAKASRGSEKRLAGAPTAPWQRLPPDTRLFPSNTQQKEQGNTRGTHQKTTCRNSTGAPPYKLYTEPPHHLDAPNEDQTHPPSMQAWAATLDAIHDKYAWVHIGVSHGEHRVSVADGLPALMALLKMSSAHVQELPDEPPLPLYDNNLTSGSSPSSPWGRRKRRGQRQERASRVLIGQQQSAASATRQLGKAVAAADHGVALYPGPINTSGGSRKKKPKQVLVPLIFVRNRASVLEELAHVEMKQGSDDNEDWGSQATLVNPSTQTVASLHPAPAQPVARIRRPNHIMNSSLPLLDTVQVDQKTKAEDWPTMAEVIREKGALPFSQRRKRTWMPSTANAPSMTKRRSTGCTVPTPFVKVVQSEKHSQINHDRRHDVFAIISGKGEKDEEAHATLATSCSPSATPLGPNCDMACRRVEDKPKESKAVPGTGSGIKKAGKRQGNLLAMWKKEDHQGQQPQPLPSSSTHVKRQERLGQDEHLAGHKHQDFYFTEDSHRPQNPVSLTNWLGARETQGQTQYGTAKQDRKRNGHQGNPSPATLWMRRVHEEGLVLSRSLTTSKKDAKDSIRQVLPGGLKIPVSLDAVED